MLLRMGRTSPNWPTPPPAIIPPPNGEPPPEIREVTGYLPPPIKEVRLDANVGIPTARDTLERTQRQIYSLRDRIQPPKQAQPTLTQYPIQIKQPEGRPPKYQYTPYPERRPYGWTKRKSRLWW